MKKFILFHSSLNENLGQSDLLYGDHVTFHQSQGHERNVKKSTLVAIKGTKELGKNVCK